MDALGQIAGGALIGVAAIWFGVPAAIAIGLIRVPALLLYRRSRRADALVRQGEGGDAAALP